MFKFYWLQGPVICSEMCFPVFYLLPVPVSSLYTVSLPSRDVAWPLYQFVLMESVIWARYHEDEFIFVAHRFSQFFPECWGHVLWEGVAVGLRVLLACLYSSQCLPQVLSAQLQARCFICVLVSVCDLICDTFVSLTLTTRRDNICESSGKSLQTSSTAESRSIVYFVEL